MDEKILERETRGRGRRERKRLGGMGESDIEVERLEREGSGALETKISLKQPLLRRSRINNTSQLAIVGSNVYPIESLDYEYV